MDPCGIALSASGWSGGAAGLDPAAPVSLGWGRGLGYLGPRAVPAASLDLRGRLVAGRQHLLKPGDLPRQRGDLLLGVAQRII